MKASMISLAGRHHELNSVVANIDVILVAMLDFPRLYLRLGLRLLTVSLFL